MIFSDNQTKHFYALKSVNTYVVKTLANSDKIRVMLFADSAAQTANTAMATTDILDRKLIKRAKVNQVKPTYFRKWTVAAPTTITEGNTYHIYFYLENMMGFGMQDRWDKVASYTAKNGDNATTVMTALRNDLDLKLNGAGPIKNDFTVTLSGTSIVVAENPNSETFAELGELDMRMHTNPYAYNVTMSTGEANGNEITPWGGQKQILGVEDSTIGTYIKAATKVLAMELYFLRNRADRYDLNKDFYASILNKTNTDTAAETYYTVDIDYAFSDTQGYTYHSDKQLSIAVPAKATADAMLTAIVGTTLDSLESRVAALEA